MDKLKVYSIFSSIDGEVNGYGQGAVSTFIRLAGCNLNCSYCDTRKAKEASSGKEMTVEEIVSVVVSHPFIDKITITGGEPLLQPEGFTFLVKVLSTLNYYISVETNGSIKPEVKGYVNSYVVDYKLKSSGETNKMIPAAFNLLSYQDFIKFVVNDEEDYKQAVRFTNTFVKRSKYLVHPRFAFSPAYNAEVKRWAIPPQTLLKWMLRDGIPNAFLNTQLHKLIFTEDEEEDAMNKENKNS